LPGHETDPAIFLPYILGKTK
jgi:hypothetical protein